MKKTAYHFHQKSYGRLPAGCSNFGPAEGGCGYDVTTVGWGGQGKVGTVVKTSTSTIYGKGCHCWHWCKRTTVGMYPWPSMTSDVRNRWLQRPNRSWKAPSGVSPRIRPTMVPSWQRIGTNMVVVGHMSPVCPHPPNGVPEPDRRQLVCAINSLFLRGERRKYSTGWSHIHHPSHLDRLMLMQLVREKQWSRVRSARQKLCWMTAVQSRCTPKRYPYFAKVASHLVKWREMGGAGDNGMTAL